MIKLVAFDMDGTFLNSDNDYDRSRFNKIYKELKERGIKPVVISGNQFAQLRSFFPDFNHEMIIVSENGALIFENNQLLKGSKFSVEVVNRVLSVLKDSDLLKYTVLCGSKHAYLQTNTLQSFKDTAAIYYYDLVEKEDLMILEDDDYCKFALIFPDELTDKLLKLLTDVCGGEVAVVSSGHGSIDIIIPGTHKGSALKWLGDRYNISLDQMMAFGDSGNDLEMLKMVGHSYAMTNAKDVIKEAAKNLAPSNNESGVLEIIEQVVLK